MAALTQDKKRDVLGEDGVLESIGAAANAVWFNGSLIARNAGGYGIAATSAAGLEIVGVADGGGNNTGGANGAKEIKLRRGQVEGIAAPTLDITDVGLDARTVDDGTVGGTADTATGLPAGRIVAYRNSKAYVEIGRFRGVNAP
ncbi:hypothetical protein [Sandaracinus amylolyticus]|uniref:hypothetical protein n=1 Tax=Sandaracinus amylolyticus TaxID=927083 RepID=UPI001F48323B|nr:hypothetical protein [Sandaracinus amylolyticus]UJR81483.1 Hypothetical protein I5071_35420 [Sandaracinus amylolyticus]